MILKELCKQLLQMLNPNTLRLQVKCNKQSQIQVLQTTHWTTLEVLLTPPWLLVELKSDLTTPPRRLNSNLKNSMLL
jgi:hypothetical protein